MWQTSSMVARFVTSTSSIWRTKSLNSSEYGEGTAGYFPVLIFWKRPYRLRPSSLNGERSTASSYKMHPIDQTSVFASYGVSLHISGDM